jgi:eukaryotic-like serine/threonine-protein kinase
MPRIITMDTTLARPPIGQLLDGRYRVESLIARGGMATVYLGTDTRLDRTVALKIMHAELATDEDFVRRFVSEARSVARLSHPNVVTVFDQGADGRTLYLAMEYVPGRTLRDLLTERGVLSPREALDIMEGVLAGLAAAHQAGIAHRDVKPENVLITDARVVKVADFGLARLVAATSQTKSGMIIGTAAYLAPEQVSGGTADARTDVYAAGVMLFELLTGRQPHTGESPLAVAHKHVNEVVPPPSSVVPGLPPALDTLVALATSRDPELRPADAGQFLQAITGVRHGLPLEGIPGGPAAGGYQQVSGYPLAPVTGPRPGGVPSSIADTVLPAGPLVPAYGGLPAPGPGWPEQPPATRDLIPGMAPPARQSFGTPPAVLTGPVTPHVQPGYPAGGQPDGSQHTLIVSGTAAPYGPPGRYHHPGSGLQQWLFSRRLGYLAAGLAVVLLLGLLGWWLTSGRYRTVPGVASLTVATARAELTAAGFTVSTGKALMDNQVARGKVIRTVPAAGARISNGSRVILIPSAGPHMIAVPQVTGQGLATAEQALRHAGLTVGKVRTAPSDTIPAGIVISTGPPAGAMQPQPDPVSLVVSAGPPVPDFVGQPVGVAQQWAQANGVSLDQVTAAHSDLPAGTVTHQSLPPGSTFTRGQVIIVKISPGPPQVHIPNVDGMQVDQATHILEGLGFSVNVNQIGPTQTVFNYSPNGRAPKGSTITLWVGL